MLTTEAIEEKYLSLPADKQQEFQRKLIYDIVDANYGDTIADFSIDSTPILPNIISGNFNTPRLGGQNLNIDYSISNDGSFELVPRNLEVIDHQESQYSAAIALGLSFAEKIGYSPLELYNFARVLKCDKGWACGGACISKEKKNCRRSLTEEHKTYVGWLKTQLDKGAALHKGHREKAAELGMMQKEPKTEPIFKPASKTKGEVPDVSISDRTTKRIAIKRLSGVPDEGRYTERLAHSVLETGVQSPVITMRNDKGGYDVVAGGQMAAALVKAKELDPRRGELQNVFVADTKEQADALKYQMQFVTTPAPKCGYSPAVPREITHAATEKLGQSSIVSVKRISGAMGRHKAEDIEKLAQSQLKVGNIVPVVVLKKGEGDYDLVRGGLAVAAARRAKEIDPKGGEKLRVFIANNKDEADALSYQIGGRN